MKERMEPFVSLVQYVATKRSRLLCLVFIPILLLTALPAWAKAGRSLYVNGHNYKVYLSNDNYITVSQGGPASGYFTVFNSADTHKSSYKVCRTYNKVPGESLAVFNNKIIYAYTADTPANSGDTSSCTATGQNKMSVWVAVFDLNPLAENPWVSNRAIGPVAINYQASSVSGAAVTVFDNQLYLFSDSGIWTGTENSKGGIAWAGPHPTFMDSHWEPLDAITIYPPNTLLYDGPRILIVYGIQQEATSTLYHINQLWGATWNGKWGADEDYFEVGSPYPTGPSAPRQYIGGTVSLTPGTASFSSWGTKEAAVQLFVKNKVGSNDKVQHIEFTYGTTMGRWRVDPTAYGSGITDLNVFLNSRQECTWFLPMYWDLRQEMYINWTEGSNKHAIVEPSDTLTPGNQPVTACGDPGAVAETDTSEPDPHDPDVLATRMHYWTLVGVILGSPPFAQNGFTVFSDYQNFSNINYGTDSSNTVEQSNSMSNSILVSQSNEVHAGLAGVAGVSVSLDMSYKHTWESSNGSTVNKSLKVTRLMGTQSSACTEMGKWGWAYFMAPRFVYENWKSRAYDYSSMDGTGTPLNMDMHIIKVIDIPDNPEASYAGVWARFELANPGGPNDDFPGLMKRTNSTGQSLAPFASSLNTRYWSTPGYTWQGPDARWITKLGSHELPELQFTGAQGTDTSLTQSTQSFESEGETTDVSLTVGVTAKAGTKVNGMSETTKIGYAGSFKTNTKTTTGFGTQVQFLLKMKSCNYPNSTPNCVSSMNVQPYWLQANPGAPWIPDAFKSQKPWAITWKITNMVPNGGAYIASPTGCPPPPLTPSWLTATAGSSTQINLAWENVAAETSYAVERSSDGGTIWEGITTTGAEVTAFNDTGLTPATTYSYRVLSVNAYGFSAPSPVATATTPGMARALAVSLSRTTMLGTPDSSALSPTATTFGNTNNPTTSGKLKASLTSSSSDGAIPGGRFGTTLPPAHASGRIVSGMGGGLGGEPFSHYIVQGGHLAWLQNGTEERIPMTADDFDPSKGVSVQIQELSWILSSGSGKWSRSRDIWTFEPRGSESLMSMELDFGSATYNIHLWKADLSGRVPAGTNIVRLLLTVNDLYGFYTDLQHEFDVDWRWSQPAADAKTLYVTSFEGRYDSATGSGKASLEGTLPADLAVFGDVEINVNEHPYFAQLVSLNEFQNAVHTGGVFKFAKEGVILVFDFGNKTWSATFNGKAFHELLSPRVGTLRTKVSVGGVPWYQAENAVLDYSANLTLSR